MMDRLKVPTRVDLAGGTLDIWPLGLLVEGALTLNVAVSAWVEISMEPSDRYTILQDGEPSLTWADLGEMAASPYRLYAEIFRTFPSLGPVSVTILRQPPRGSGLGASSALMLLLMTHASRITGREIDHDRAVALCRDIEVRLLGFPTGTQDYFPPLYGGGLAIHYGMGGWRVERLPWLEGLESSLSVYHTGVEHHSGSVNWEVFKRGMEGGDKTRGVLQEIADISIRARQAWMEEDLPGLGALVGKEWAARKSLHPANNHPVIDEVLIRSGQAGAWGGKATGAGGGGCVVILHPPGIRAELERSLKKTKGHFLDCRPTLFGLLDRDRSKGGVTLHETR